VHRIETINKIAHFQADAERNWARADAGRACREARHAAGEGAQGSQDRQGAASLETPIGDEEDSHLGDFIEDKNAILPIDAAIQSNLRETTRVLALAHPARGAAAHAIGIGMNTDHTLEEVSQQFSVTRERIRQIEAKALRKLKHPSRSRKLRSFLDN
jgi:DNA-directed RNA polymerase sigma subunit (sigma70/sigma32)